MGDRWQEAWVGKNSDEVIRSWGAPNGSMRLNNGDKLLHYETHSYDDFIGLSSSCVVKFFVSPKGIIKSFRYKGCTEPVGKHKLLFPKNVPVPGAE